MYLNIGVYRIAEAVGCQKSTVNEVICSVTENLPESKKAAANHLVEGVHIRIGGFFSRMACYTQEEIAEAVGCGYSVINDVISSETANLPERSKAFANHLVDFEPPVAGCGRPFAESSIYGQAGYY